MKYVILRCEDEARGAVQPAALLEGAKMSHLQHLAQAGSVGTIRSRGTRGPMDRAQIHRAVLGLGTRDQEASPGRWYAAGANLELAPGERAWCCDLVTHQDGNILDPTAGRIPTKESAVLIQAIEEQLGSDTRRWSIGQEAHHVFITREVALQGDGRTMVRSPELLIGQPWKQHLPRGPRGEALGALIEEAANVLEHHPVNRVRVDLGENPANLMWLWGVAEGGAYRTFSDRSGLSGAVLSRGFLTRGLALALGMEWREAPASVEESTCQQLVQAAGSLLARHDLVYVHLRIQSADPVERLCAMERIDQFVLKAFTEQLPRLGSWRLLAVIDNRQPRWIPVIALGTGLPQHPVALLDAQRIEESPLIFKEGAGIFSWFTQQTADREARGAAHP